MKLKIFSNKTQTQFRIGWDDKNFDMCSDEDLKEGISSLSEEDITNLEQNFGAITEYYDFRSDKVCSKEEYVKHFINYNSDKCYIVPITTFTSREKAEICRGKLSKQ